MAAAGLLADWDEVRLTLTLSSTVSRTANAPGIVNSARLVTKFDDNPASLTEGVRMECDTGYFIEVPPGEKWKYRLYLRWHPDWTGSPWTRTGSGHKASMDQHLIFEGVRLYMLASGVYSLVVDAVKWYVEDVLEETLSGFTMLSVGSIAAARIPVLGIPAKVLAASTPSDLPVQYGEGEAIQCVEWVQADATAQTNSASGSATATGGWTFTLDAVQYDLPITLNKLAPPAGGAGCPFGLALPALTGSRTDDISASADCDFQETIALIGDESCGKCPDGSDAVPPSTIRWWSREGYSQIRNSGAMALPDLTKAVRRLQDVAADYEALIERYQFPLAEARASRVCADLSWNGCPCPNIFYDTTLSTATRNAAHAPRIEVVDEAAKDIEAPLGEASYAPYGQTATRIGWKTFIGRLLDPGGCETPPPVGPGGGDEGGCCTPAAESGYYKYESVESTFPAITMQGGEIGLYEHADPEAAYINYHAHPHASLLYHFPPDTDSVNWKALGSKRTSEDYWLRIRQQYSHLDSVGRYVGASTKRRPDIVTAPLLSALSSVISTAFAFVRTFWWGISRFSLDERDPAASVTVDETSEDRWSAANATLTIDASGVTLHPANTTPVLEFDLGDLGVPPYLYPQAAKQVTLPSFPANVASVSVYLEGQGGDRVLLATASGTHSKSTSGVDTGYAGTWAQDFLLTRGADVLPGGVSNATFESVERVHTPELIVGMTAAKLVYEFTLASTADTLIGFPTFLFATTDATIVHETGQASSLLWEDAPGIRYGQMDVYDTVARAYRPVPLYRPPGSLMSAVDYIAWRNLLYDAQAVNAGSESDLALWFDDTELGWPDNPRVFGGAIDTMVVPRKVAGKVGAQWLVINAVREVFPLACFPQKEREATSLAFVSPISFDQRAYSMAVVPKRYLSRAAEMDLIAPGSLGAITGPSPLVVPEPWRLREHRVALTNEEPEDSVVIAGEQLASARRWHGYFGLAPGAVKGQVHLTRSLHSGLLFAVIVSDTLDVWRFNFAGAHRFAAVLQQEVNSAQIALSPGGQVVVAYEVGGEVFRTESLAQGEAWSTPAMIAEGTEPAIAIHDISGTEFLVLHDGADFVCYRKLSASSSWQLAGTVVTAPAARGGLEVSPDALARLVFVVEVSGEIRRYISTDRGATWIEA